MLLSSAIASSVHTIQLPGDNKLQCVELQCDSNNVNEA
jgi:hypothetical protein